MSQISDHNLFVYAHKDRFRKTFSRHGRNPEIHHRTPTLSVDLYCAPCPAYVLDCTQINVIKINYDETIWTQDVVILPQTCHRTLSRSTASNHLLYKYNHKLKSELQKHLLQKKQFYRKKIINPPHRSFVYSFFWMNAFFFCSNSGAIWNCYSRLIWLMRMRVLGLLKIIMSWFTH